MKEKVNTMNVGAIETFFQALRRGFENFKEQWLDPDVSEETELPEELYVALNNVDEDANKLIDRKYTPKKKKSEEQKKTLQENLAVENLVAKEPTESTSRIEENNDRTEENTESKEF